MINSFTGKYGFLSNFHPSIVKMGTLLFPSVEHAYQAAKTLDEKVRLQFSLLPTAGQAKRQGKSVKLRPDWEFVKDGIMLDLVREKFTSYPDLKALLLATGDEQLVEGNWWGDHYWGVCRGQGQNKLGKILMQVRGEL